MLAGGGARRLDGADKPALLVGGRRLLDAALAAVPGAQVVVVGPERPLPPGVRLAREDPPGGGPAAGLMAGMAVLQPGPEELVAVLAADLPGITGELLDRLAGLVETDGPAGALAVDEQGRRQWLIGVWRAAALAQAIAARDQWDGARLADLLEPLRPALLRAAGDEIADIDTHEDLRRWRERPVEGERSR